MTTGAGGGTLECASVRKCPPEGRAHLGFMRRLITVIVPSSPHLTPTVDRPETIPALTSTAGLLDNRNIGVIGVEDVHDIHRVPASISRS